MARLAREPGTRVLLMVSTGFLSGMLDAERDAAIDHAIHAGIVINALDAKGLWAEAAGRTFGHDAQTYKGFPDPDIHLRSHVGTARATTR